MSIPDKLPSSTYQHDRLPGNDNNSATEQESRSSNVRGKALPAAVSPGDLSRHSATVEEPKSTGILGRIRKIYDRLLKRDQMRRAVGHLAGGIPTRRGHLAAIQERKTKGQFVIVRKEVFLNENPLEVGSKSFIKKVGARAAVQEGVYKNLEPLKSGNIEVQGCRIDEEGKLILNEVIPTAYIKAKPQKSNHLVNCYKAVNNDWIMLRSGVIDTAQKGSEFFQVCRTVSPQKGEKKKIRVVSHQLNSPGPKSLIPKRLRRLIPIKRMGEKKLIENQHKWLNDAKEKNPDMDIAHVNTQCNRGYEMSKWKMLGEHIGQEEPSRELNREAMVTYLSWLAEDLPKDLIHKDELTVSSDILGDREKLKEVLEEKVKSLKKIEKGLKSRGEDKAFRTVSLMRQLLKHQLGIGKPVDRGKEIMMFQLLNRNLNVISAVNCKSGLDRTGFAYAVMMALSELSKKDAFDLIEHWEDDTRLVNLLLHQERGPVHVTGPKRERIVDFRNRVLENLLKISMPITGSSTGLMGIKWHKGRFTANKIPLNFLPPIIKIEKEDGKIVEKRILTYKDNGKVDGLTEIGQNLILQLSDYRGT
ncbi:MAG: hypothetical protein WB791_03465 [Waddliaceae bacterium]